MKYFSIMMVSCLFVIALILNQQVEGKNKGRIDLIRNKVFIILDIAPAVVDGEMQVSIGKEKEYFGLAVKVKKQGRIEVPVNNGKYSAFCFKTLHMAPNSRVPVKYFQPIVEPSGRPKTKSVQISSDFAIEGKLKTKLDDILVSGEKGALLEKVENGFILKEGSAYLLQHQQ